MQKHPESQAGSGCFFDAGTTTAAFRGDDHSCLSRGAYCGSFRAGPFAAVFHAGPTAAVFVRGRPHPFFTRDRSQPFFVMTREENRATMIYQRRFKEMAA